jgi:hypothetical protein
VVLFNYFMLEISRGNMFFAATVEECRAMAREHQKVLATDEDRPGVPAMAIYSVVIKQPDEAIMLTLLNSLDESGQTAFNECVVDRQLVEVVAD